MLGAAVAIASVNGACTDLAILDINTTHEQFYYALWNCVAT